MNAQPTAMGAITALVNRLLAGKRKPNHKRIFRIMKRRNFPSSATLVVAKGRLHDGIIGGDTLEPALVLRCLRDHCWNGDIVRIVFVVDAHDREVLTARHRLHRRFVVRDLTLETLSAPRSDNDMAQSHSRK